MKFREAGSMLYLKNNSSFVRPLECFEEALICVSARVQRHIHRLRCCIVASTINYLRRVAE